VEHANDRLKRRKLEKKELARALVARGIGVSEMMVLRALHPDQSKRVATLETIEAISDALGLPRPVVVAATPELALELQSVLAFNAVDAERLRISAEVDREKDLQSAAGSGADGGDGRKTRLPRDVDGDRARAAGVGPKTVRRTPRAR